MFQLGHAKARSLSISRTCGTAEAGLPFFDLAFSTFFSASILSHKVHYFAFDPQTLPRFDYVLPLINLVSTMLLSKTLGRHFITPLQSHEVLQYDSLEVAVHVVAN